MSTSIAAEGLDVDDLGHVFVVLSDEPSEQWMEAFRERWADAGTTTGAAAKTDAFSHFAERRIVFRGIDVDGFIEHCKNPDPGCHQVRQRPDAAPRDRARGSHSRTR